MFKIEKIKKELNILFGSILIILLLFLGIQFPNVYIKPNQTPILNIPVIIAFLMVFSLFICFNISFRIKKDQITKIEVIDNEE